MKERGQMDELHRWLQANLEFSRTLVGGAELLIVATCLIAAVLILMAGLLSRIRVRKLERKILDLEKQLAEARTTASRRLSERIGALTAAPDQRW
jgi:uncharacterized membrane protein YciS (DUF1049 family)